MKILVLIKQVPGTTSVAIDEKTGVLLRDGRPAKLNPYDLYALELGVSLTEKYGGECEVLTMGPPQAENAVLECVYMGAARGYVLSDRKFAGSDVCATSRALSSAINTLGGYDLVIAGKQTTDGDTAQVGSEVAEMLHLPHIGNVFSVEEVNENKLTVNSSLDGLNIKYRLPLPCLICADADINTPRLPSYKRKKTVTSDAVKMLGFNDLNDADESKFGINGSPTQVEKIFTPEKKKEKTVYECGDLANLLYDALKAKKFI